MSAKRLPLLEHFFVRCRMWQFLGFHLPSLRLRLCAFTSCAKALCVSPPIRQALPGNPFQQQIRALCITDAEGRAIRVPKVKFGHVAMQMLLANVVESSDQSTLEDREESFNRVRGHAIARIFSRAMLHRFVRV